ncbi:MAG TPA: MMPL family transporter [Candidatus Methylacidiphilales bacterium]|nr:MMPL family transporter [Candidatus Methylacidiphilales bacterium]
MTPSSRGAEPDPSANGAWSSGSVPHPADELPIKRHYTRRRAACSVIFWVLMAAVFMPAAFRFSERIQSTLSGMKGTPSETVRENIVKNFSTALAFPTAIVWDAEGVPPDQAESAWQHLLAAVRGDKAMIQDVTDGRVMIENWPRKDWYAAFVAFNPETPASRATSASAYTYGDAEMAVRNLRASVVKITLPGPLQPWVTGGPALFFDLNQASTESLRSGEVIALPVTFLILLLVFRTLLAALLPVLVATLGVVCTLGILSFFAGVMHITFFVPNLVTMIGLGVGIDYCLIYLARYRRERANHLTTQEALQIAHKTAGKTVIVSAVMVMSGFLTLFFIPLEFFTSIAVGGVLVVACVALATLTLLPAMIFLAGSKLEWGGNFLGWLQKFRPAPEFCENWARFVVFRPRLCAAAGLLILGLLAIPFFRLNIASVEARNIPPHSESRLGYESLARNLGAGWMMPAIILVQHPTEDWMNSDGLAAEKRLVDELSDQKAFPNTEKIITVTDSSGSRRIQQSRMGLLTSYSDPSQSVILMLSRGDPQSPVARDWLDRIAQKLDAIEKADPNGPRYFLGGLPSVTLSADRIIMDALPRVILVTLCSTFILLLCFMRSLLVAIKAIVLNLICVMAAYGFQVLCFQDGWGARLCHLFATDGLNTVVLVICFCALFGLSMDYEVFILSAVRESWLDQHNMRLAVQEGLIRVAGIISSAAIIMISVFLAFGFGDVVEIEQLGVGLSFAVLLDATVIRLLIVPGVMILLGKWAFWMPGHALPVAERHPRGHHYDGQKINSVETNRMG